MQPTLGRAALASLVLFCASWNIADAHQVLRFDARVRHGQTVLADGRVLVTGGELANELVELGTGATRTFTRAAAVFDPRTGTWASAGSLTHSRTRHSAIALRDGRAIVLGGGISLDPDASVEEWDGRLGWRRVGRLRQGRFGHSATLLADGRILVVGGSRDDLGGDVPGGNVLASAEIWDPASRTSVPAASLPIAVTEHAAVRLRDGRVLVTGGTRWWGGVPPETEPTSDRAFVWDPAVDRWTEVGRMSGARSDHAASVLRDGRVLVVGNRVGHDEAACRADDTACLSASLRGDVADVFDPRTGRFSATRATRFPRLGDQQLVTLADGRVAVYGVLVGDCVPDVPQVVEVWDPATGAWSDVGDAPVTMQEGFRASVLADGRVLLTGGEMRPNRRGLLRAASSFALADPATARAHVPAREPNIPRAVME